LEKVTSLIPAPEHISAYSLIIEEGTPFFSAYEGGELILPEEEEERDMYELTREILLEKGYRRYEISNYAKAGRECRHNTGYWTRKNYVGFGVGAASLVKNVRFKNTDDIESYISASGDCKTEEEVLTREEQMEEFMFLGLRMTDGISYQGFRDCFDCSLDAVYGEVVQKHIGQGLLRIYEKGAEKYLCLTERGLNLSNYVMADFLEP